MPRDGTLLGHLFESPVTLSDTVDGEDVADLHWLAEEIGDQLLDAAVVNSGPGCYRREDGIGLIPASLPGP